MTQVQSTPDLEMGSDIPTQQTNDPVEGVVYENYWGVDETFKFILPDGVQYFEVRPMDEGAKVKFQKLTNKAVRMNQRTEEASFDIDPAEERHTLIKQSVVSYHIMQKGPNNVWEPYPCPPASDTRFRRSLEQLLEHFNPKVIQDLEFFIRTKNPWMQADMDLDEIDKEIGRLETLRRQKLDEEAGEGSSANK
jgi:hypothetical protein